MTKEIKDGFVIHDRRFWVEDEDRDAEPEGPSSPPPPSIDAETLRSALADLEEAKNRVRRDAERQIELMRAQVLEALLPVLDNLERSLAAAAGAASVDSLVNGVGLVHTQFLHALAQFGLSRRSAVGERFDPRLHDAIAVIPVADAHQDGVVLAETEPAYCVGDRVIRPAKVQVGRAADRAQS
jgi:molecular chaperone GrpE (heat shock protein)